VKNKNMIITVGIIILIVIIVAIVTSNNKVTYAVNDSLVNTVISKSQGSSWSSGASGAYNVSYTKEDGTKIGNDYRYVGANPNNYVRFNNDMYQIIGVFDENTHGIQGKQLVKLIRARALGSYSWGVHNSSLIGGEQSVLSSDWTGSDSVTPANLNILLNEYFYNKTDVSDTYGSCGDWAYYSFSSSGNNYRINNCERFKIYGIDSKVRNYIQPVTFYLNGHNDGDNLNKNNWYLRERGLHTNSESANNGEYDSETISNIGLMYPSDYLYASGYFSSSNTTGSANSYHGNQNWLYKGTEWLMTPISGSSNQIYDIYYSGYLFVSKNISESNIIRPAFYLKEDVYVTGGTGTFDNPYTLDCDTCSD